MATVTPGSTYGKALTAAGYAFNPPSASPGSTPSSLYRQPYTSGALTGTGQYQAGGANARPESGTYAFDSNTANPWAPSGPLQDPGNNLTNPGYGEQALNVTQNRLLEDPWQDFMRQQAQGTQNPSAGEQYINQNLGTLNGPGQGDQYWQQVQGQYMDPFAGEQFARQATQNFQAQGPASSFFNDAMGQYDQFTGYTGPQNTQGAYGQAQQQLGNGTMGQQGLQQLAGQYGNIGQYSDPNLAAGQYAQTQQAFGDMPIANFDPFFDRARQLGVQAYNQGAAGRGVYGSSEALSGVGNVITDIEAQRALKGFDAEMQRAQEQRMRQQLLGEQARMGDLSSLAAFASNLAGVETFGNINNQMGQLQNQSQSILGQMANNADSQALGAQNANIAGLNAFGDLASSADRAETDRYQASTNAMNQADRTALDRMNSGANVADMVDDNARDDYRASTDAAVASAGMQNDRTRLGADIANTASDNDLARLDSFNATAQGAEEQRQARRIAELDSVRAMSKDLQDFLGRGMESIIGGSQEDFENWFNAEMAPVLQAAGYDQQATDALRKDLMAAAEITEAAATASSKGTSDKGAKNAAKAGR